MSIVLTIKKELRSYSSPRSVKDLQRFFKTELGDYGEEDLFLGVKVPNIRKVAKKYINLDLKNVEKLLHSKMHEKRLVKDLWKHERVF